MLKLLIRQIEIKNPWRCFFSMRWAKIKKFDEFLQLSPKYLLAILFELVSNQALCTAVDFLVLKFVSI